MPGRRHSSLLHGEYLVDVVITGAARKGSGSGLGSCSHTSKVFGASVGSGSSPNGDVAAREAIPLFQYLMI